MDAVRLFDGDDLVPQLTLSGVVDGDVSSFGLGYALYRPVEPAAPEPPDSVTWVAVDLLGSDGSVLVTVTLAALPLCEVPDPAAKQDVKPSAGYLVDGLLPLVEGIASLQVRQEEGTVFQRLFPQSAPEVSMPSVDIYKDHYVVSWTASHPDDAQLEHVVLVHGEKGGPWLPVSLPTSMDKLEIPASSLQSGQPVQFAVLTTDGLHSVISEPAKAEMLFSPPLVGIVEPRSPYVQSPVSLGAYTPTGSKERQWRVEWESNQDGLVAVGEAALAELSAGKHVLTATLRDSVGAAIAADQVDFVVEN